MHSLMTLLTRVEDTLPIYVLDLTLKTTVILLLAVLAVWILRRSSSAMRHAILTAALLSLIALPLLSRGLPRLEVPVFTEIFRPVVQTESNKHRVSPEPLFESAEESHIFSASIQNETTTDEVMALDSNVNSAVATSASALRGRLPLVGLAVWMLGVLSVLLAITIGEIRALCLRFASSRLHNSEWNRSLSEITRQYGLVRRVTLLENSTISVPMTCGTIRPAILIPTGFNSSSAECRRILQHEIAHVIRFDVGLQTLGRVACAIYWFHPLAWWCLRQMHHEREQACDDWVLRAGERRTEYAEQLLAIAKRELTPQPASAAVGFVRNGKLEKRVQAILNDDCSHAAMGRVRGALLIAVTICICITVAIIHPRPLVAANPENQKGGSQEKSVEQDVESKIAPTKTNRYNFSINATGLALDTNGEPILGATIYLSSKLRLGDTRPIYETITDANGRYMFENINLPISRSDFNSGLDHGGFIVFGTAKGHGFTWRPQKSFYPNPKPSGTTFGNQPDDDLPSRYEGKDKIELDLTFPESSTIRGTVVDEDGEPIANTKLALWNAEKIPKDGYGPRRPDSDRRPFNSYDRNEFELLNANVPPEMWIRHTDSKGQFEFTGVPKGKRLRVKVQPPGFPSRIVWFTTRTGTGENEDAYRIHDASKGVELTFQNTVDVPIRVVYADTEKPAPDVKVSGYNKLASTSKTSGKDGRVSLALPPGEFDLELLPAYGTPYLEADSNFTVGDESPINPIVAKLPAAGQVEVRVVDKETGNGIENVKLWRETPGWGRRLHITSAWEVTTRIVHRERQRSDKNGIIQAVFEPGKHRIGPDWQSIPRGYERYAYKGIEIECEAGKMSKVVFELERRSEN